MQRRRRRSSTGVSAENLRLEFVKSNLGGSIAFDNNTVNTVSGGNIRMNDGDVIVVGPYDCLVNISGKVKRPMYYEMKRNESLASLLRYSGGFTGDAYKKSVRVMRKDGAEYSVFNVNEFETNEFRLADADSVTVDSVINRYSNMVEVKGAVFRPGMYNVGTNITTIKQLIEAASVSLVTSHSSPRYKSAFSTLLRLPAS